MSDETGNEAIESAPLACLVLDDDNRVAWANRRAVELLRVEPGIDFTTLVHPRFLDSYRSLWLASGEAQTCCLELLADTNTRYVELTALMAGGRRHLWVADLSEARALRAQLQRQKQPGRRFLHEIANAVTASVGYGELIQILLNERDTLSPASLANARRYMNELNRELKRIDSLLDAERTGHAQLKSSRVTPVNRRHVLIVDDEPGVAQFLSELMRGRQHKVTTFTDGRAALEYFHANSADVDLVILDQSMPGITGIAVATEMLAQSPALPVILCTGDQQVIEDQMSGKLNIRHFISKPIDINELMQTVMMVLEPAATQ